MKQLPTLWQAATRDPDQWARAHRSTPEEAGLLGWREPRLHLYRSPDRIPSARPAAGTARRGFRRVGSDTCSTLVDTVVFAQVPNNAPRSLITLRKTRQQGWICRSPPACNAPADSPQVSAAFPTMTVSTSCVIITRLADRKDGPKRTWRRRSLGTRRNRERRRAPDRSRCPLPQQPSSEGVSPCRIEDSLLRVAGRHKDGLSRKPRRRSHCCLLRQPSAAARRRRQRPRQSQARWLIRRQSRRGIWGRRIPPRKPSTTAAQRRIPRREPRATWQRHGYRQAARRPMRAQWRSPRPRPRVISPRPQFRSPPWTEIPVRSRNRPPIKEDHGDAL